LEKKGPNFPKKGNLNLVENLKSNNLRPVPVYWVIVVFFPAIEVFINGIKMIIGFTQDKEKRRKR